MKNILLLTIVLISACGGREAPGNVGMLLDPWVEREELCLATSGDWRVYFIENPNEGWGEIRGRCSCPEGTVLTNMMCFADEF